MKILGVQTLVIPEIKIIKFARFSDNRGYFTEPFRRSDFNNHIDLSFFAQLEFVQVNESFSNPGVIRGLHFQWNPYMGKLVRTLHGRMVDMFLDIRVGSPTFGKISAYEMPSNPDMDYSEWIWIPPGFAHGNYFSEPTTIEYFCTGEYSPGCEAGISPVSTDIDWSLTKSSIKQEFENIVKTGIVSDKDKQGLSVESWKNDDRSKNFVYGKL